MPLKVNPNRMELLRLRRRLNVARRGHKLLEDKLEGLIQKFMEEAKNYKMMREQTVNKFLEFLYHTNFIYAKLPSFVLRDLVDINDGKVILKEKVVKQMNVPISIVSIESVYFPQYSFLETPQILDELILKWEELLREIIELSNKEKELLALSEEIEKTKRRVNALEYKLIPQLEETVKYITTKLEELERSNFSRLLKLKEL